jgi:uncharacterized protein YkwD
MADAPLANKGDVPEGRRRMRRFLQLGVTVALTLALGAVVSAPAAVAVGRDAERHELLVRTNDSRGSFERSDVRIDRQMSQLVRRHSSWMARTGSFRHTSDPGSAYLKGVAWHCWGENIAVSGGSMRDVEKAFMHSPDHRANILNPCFKHVAIGIVRDDDGVAWVTVFFYG